VIDQRGAILVAPKTRNIRTPHTLSGEAALVRGSEVLAS
jgi:hypothetical protein